MNRDFYDTSAAGHVSPEDLAVLAEGTSRDDMPREAIEHLSRCRSCMSAYADLVRYRAGWLAFPEAFEGGEGAPSTASRRGSSARAGEPKRLLRVAAAACAVLAIGVVSLLSVRRAAPPDTGPIAALIERASAEGLVIPGGEAAAADPVPNYRSGRPLDEASGRALDRLRVDYERAPERGREVHELVAGLVAAGKLALARDYIAEGLRRAPDDSRLLTLAGIAAQMEGDLANAERRLREALRVSPMTSRRRSTSGWWWPRLVAGTGRRRAISMMCF